MDQIQIQGNNIITTVDATDYVTDQQAQIDAETQNIATYTQAIADRQADIITYQSLLDDSNANILSLQDNITTVQKVLPNIIATPSDVVLVP